MDTLNIDSNFLTDFFDNWEDDLDSDAESVGDIDESDHETSQTARQADHRPIQQAHTDSFKAQFLNAGKRPLDAVHAVFDALKTNGLTLSWFWGLVLYGDEECTSDPKVKFERAGLLNSVDFRESILRCAKPPGGRAKRGREVVEGIATEIVGQLVAEDIKAIADLMTAGEDALSREKLTALDMKKLCEELKERALTLWTILEKAGWSKSQVERNTHKTPENVIMNVIAILSYTRSHHHNRLQMFWALYLKHCGLSARAFDTLHALGFVMSHKWTCDALLGIATSETNTMVKYSRERAIFGTFDNENIPRRVFSQRINNQNMFISATGGTLWVLPKHIPVDPELNRKYQEGRREGAKECFNYRKLLEGNADIQDRQRAQDTWQITSFLINSPALETYPDRGHTLFDRPVPVDELPCGREHIPEQFMFSTADIDEASYEGVEKVIHEWFRQLKMDSLEEMKKTSTGRFFPWGGDALTTSRLRGLALYKGQDINSYERMDYLVGTNGFLHIMFAVANSIHAQYLGESGGIGLRRAFDKLKRKGLLTTSIKGPFWHHLDEALWHVGEAMILACWMEATGVERLEELVAWPPEALATMAGEIYENFACRKALARTRTTDPEDQDEVNSQAIMFLTDLLPYFNLRDSIKRGDVGRIQDLLPWMLLRFEGGSNSNYTKEILELLQGLEREWQPDVK
ncbi:uncharacterized protein STEHIDRAFT_111829 [Stereum hirsutum FP-91666 SS1]|uniref:uncharacterized protein n=1 Tax=Stereum hirsutum (strain FP-91666) TaxID=721885 RepID=UPI0004449580|nr:uncharacterized protein STEHIDRAFT_111829 [Stereum hirsutum FP-91666 SS1]EIM85200.1 hypothetical protein STEHIDRAFT_111829 [Stereum hirsutum FP-91666 SS1]